MAGEFDYQSELAQALETGTLLAEIAQYLNKNQPLGEMIHMDEDVAEAITPQEYESYLRYKQYCLEELGEFNRTPGCNGALNSSIERGFILGYWFALQRQKVQK
jgi:hypothetical protein